MFNFLANTKSCIYLHSKRNSMQYNMRLHTQQKRWGGGRGQMKWTNAFVSASTVEEYLSKNFMNDNGNEWIVQNSAAATILSAWLKIRWKNRYNFITNCDTFIENISTINYQVRFSNSSIWCKWLTWITSTSSLRLLFHCLVMFVWFGQVV